MSSSVTSKPPLFRIGMLGAGTVGGGVYELLMGDQAGEVKGNNIVVSKICVRSLDKPRDFHIHQESTQLTTNPLDLLNDDGGGIDCIVEVAGGCGVAKQVVMDALKAGKSVVTANKALLFEHMKEVEEAAANTPLGYEAAVCGGIPIINALTTAYTGDSIQNITGICNGTTNYMLSAMEADSSVSYDAVLKEAQDLGFAEADPTADVEGHDVRAKIAIFAKLAFGKSIGISEIPCTGISSITATDFLFAKSMLHSTIKLVGTAARDNNKLSVYVTPAMVPTGHILANISGCGNCVSVTSSNLGTCNYTGPGAGRYPTSNSVVADVYRAAAGALPKQAFPTPQSCNDDETNLEVVTDYTSSFYVRVPCKTTAGDVVCRMGALADEHSVKISSFQQRTVDGTTHVALTTCSKCRRSNIDSFSQALPQQDFCVGTPIYMPILKSDDE